MPKDISHPRLKKQLKAAQNYSDEQKAKRTKQMAEKPSLSLKHTDLVAFNQGAEKTAVQYLTEYIQRKGSPMFNTACSLIALEVNVSTETAKRYLQKYSVDHPKAPFSIQDGYVKIRQKE